MDEAKDKDTAESCPVCGMRTEDWTGNHSAEYHKMYFHFCSEQCRDTFQAHPALYSSKRAKAAGEIIKSRRLRLATSLDSQAAATVCAGLQQLMGLKDAQVDGRWLKLRYDLLQLTLLQIENALCRMDVSLDDGWWQRQRRSWAREAESNELDNLASSPAACCNRPPPGT